MFYLPLTAIFGEGVTQDAITLTIQKASLLRLTPVVSNTAESLLVAILITALQNFQGAITDENNHVITDENNQPITFDNSDVFELVKMIGWEPYQSSRDELKVIINQIIVFLYDAI